MEQRLFILVLLAGIIGGSWWFMNQNKPARSEMPIVSATIGTGTFRLHAPQDEQGRKTGLAAFDSLAQDEGMILRGMPVGRQSIWMKNMKFDIDVLWVNKDNQIIYIVQGMSKSDQQTIYHNPVNAPSAYVIELPDESCNKYGIATGQLVTIAN